MIITPQNWKQTLTNNGIVTFSPFNEGVERKRYQLTCMDNQYEINYELLDETFESIYEDMLIPLFNGELPHGENPLYAQNIFVVASIIDSLVFVTYTYAFDELEQAQAMAQIVDADDIYDNVDDDLINFFTEY